MPIVYIHGVATRDPGPDPIVTALMTRYLSEVISPGRDVAIEYAYWGDVAATFAWDGAARPRSPLLGQGVNPDAGEAARTILAAELSEALNQLPQEVSPAVDGGGALVPAGPGRAAPAAKEVRLKDLTAEQLSDLLAVIVTEQAEPGRRAALLIAADEVAHDPTTSALLALAPDVDTEWATIATAIEERVPGGALVGMGAGGLARVGDRIREALGRGAGLPGYVASRVVAEFREPVNRMATMFVGDVLAYVRRRGDLADVGIIPSRLLGALDRARSAAPADEPLVVVSHSMGGQIVYDAVTSFLPGIGAYRDLRVDFWCATASQVGLFEELKLFLASSDTHHTGSKVPFPSRTHLGGWWNVWDHNDFISYTSAPIFEGVDDEAFDTGMTLVGAHSGYLVRPSFYRRFAAKLAEANAAGWYR